MSATPVRETEIIRIASLREDARISQIEAHFKGDEEFILTAIVKGWSIEEATNKYHSEARSSKSGYGTGHKQAS
jgi:hypothetical protein